MKTSTRLLIVSVSAVLCFIGFLMASGDNEKRAKMGSASDAISSILAAGDYQFASSSAHASLTFRELENLIRRDPTAKSQRGRIEFGSVKMEQRLAVAEVMFIHNDRVTPFLYKLQPERDSWKIVNVQRMWYVPRSHLLRGVRV
ncbi:MAG TPA: hypothetical protein VFA58_01880 [Chthoniobacterales bacterium]|nr:hypothetical protein [Chthoniobacterales bacterium]